MADAQIRFRRTGTAEAKTTGQVETSGLHGVCCFNLQSTIVKSIFIDTRNIEEPNTHCASALELSKTALHDTIIHQPQRSSRAVARHVHTFVTSCASKASAGTRTDTTRQPTMAAALVQDQAALDLAAYVKQLWLYIHVLGQLLMLLPALSSPPTFPPS